VLKYRDKIRDALYKDFRKHPSEVDIAEIYPITSDIKHTKSHLSKWMRPRKVTTLMSQLGSSSYIHYEPKGVVLIISPWNFPVRLTFGPLISAIAAGNCVMLKPSEHTPNASSVMKMIITEIFDESEVALIEGDVDVSTELLKLPFNHIFFTGAPEIGKIVMKAAAEHLASVTLELGGKSPTIVDETADLKIAAKRIVFGKWYNNGQVCIAPDYVLVHKSISQRFLEEIKKTLISFYGEDANAFQAVHERSQSEPEGYHPMVKVSTHLTPSSQEGAGEGQGEFLSPSLTMAPASPTPSKKKYFNPSSRRSLQGKALD
jgi:aldehyde dehydrogenase (NAD+)